MRRLFASSKAFSALTLVVILVMISVGAFIAVAAWIIGQSTLEYAATEHVTLSNIAWGPDNENVNLTFENTGAVDLSIKELKIAGVNPRSINPTLDSPCLLKRGNSVTFVVDKDGGFGHNVHYMIMVTTSKGNSFGPYQKIAP